MTQRLRISWSQKVMKLAIVDLMQVCVGNQKIAFEGLRLQGLRDNSVLASYNQLAEAGTFSEELFMKTL